MGLVLPAVVGPLYAYDFDTHYLWTYYLALQAGFTERQAFQIASATFVIDDDPQTGPMHAMAMDSLFGLETELYRSPEVADATRDLAIDGRDVMKRVHELMVSGLRVIGNPDGTLTGDERRKLAEHFERVLDGLEDSSFLWGASYEYWREVSRPVIRNVWSNFHAFAQSELLPAAVQPVTGTREFAVDVYIAQVLWNFMPLWVYLDPVHFSPGLLDMRPGKIQILTENAMAARDREANLLWNMALVERNPGPFMHFAQDSFSHGEFDNIRGHASWGHKPDFLSYDLPKSQRMTLTTLHALCRYRDAVVPASLSDVEGAPGYERTPVCDFLFFWLEHDPPDPITFYTQRMNAQSLIAGRAGEPIRGGVSAPTGRRDSDPVLSRIFDVLDRMVGANPLPEHVGNWDPGMLPAQWFSTMARGVVDRKAALRTIWQAIAEDKQADRLPAVKGGNLEETWGYPPSVGRAYGPSGAPLGIDKGVVWPDWVVPEHYTEFDYDPAGFVLVRDPEDYLGSSTYLARIRNHGAIADRFEEVYPVELPWVDFTDTVSVRFESHPVPEARPGRPAPEDADRIDVFVTLEYDVKGVKDLRSVNWVGETVYWDSEFIRISSPTGEQAGGGIPLPVIEACTFDGYPYELRRRGSRRGRDNVWGSDGSGDDWGTRVKSRDIGTDNLRADCRGCVETDLHFKIPKSVLSAGSLEGTCSVHLYGQAPWEKTFRVPVALVTVGELKRGGGTR